MKVASAALAALLLSGGVALAQPSSSPSSIPAPLPPPSSPPTIQSPNANPVNPQDRTAPNPQDMTSPLATNPQTHVGR
jgi:hypothetical protein